MLERYFRDKFMQSGLYTDIGMYWNRKGENEIDLITLNDLDKTAAIYEIKEMNLGIVLPNWKRK